MSEFLMGRLFLSIRNDTKKSPEDILDEMVKRGFDESKTKV